MSEPKPILDYREPEPAPRELPADPDAGWEKLDQPTGRRRFSFWTLFYVVALIGIVAYMISILIGLARHAGVW